MAWITPVQSEEELDEKGKAFLAERGKDFLQNKKGAILLKNSVVYDCIEKNAWKIDDEIQRLLSKRLGDLLEYVVSKENNSKICLAYFTKCLADQGIDFETTSFTREEQLIIDFTTAVIRDRHHIPEDLKKNLKEVFTEEQLAVIVATIAIINSDNLFETVFEI